MRPEEDGRHAEPHHGKAMPAAPGKAQEARTPRASVSIGGCKRGESCDVVGVGGVANPEQNSHRQDDRERRVSR